MWTWQGLRALALHLSPSLLAHGSKDVARCEHLFNTLGEGVIVATPTSPASPSQGEAEAEGEGEGSGGLRHLPLDPLAYPCRSPSHNTPHPPLPTAAELFFTYSDVC